MQNNGENHINKKLKKQILTNIMTTTKVTFIVEMRLLKK
jgi:hypothetical protein